MRNPAQPRSASALANGVRLHYLDWGGSGPAVVFLAGFGNTPHFFDSVARQLVDRFHVLGFTRRAHGESEQPESGYDIATLANDAVGLLDAFGIERARFVGHSFAGSEMVELAVAHPDRVEKLVFLDALYEYEKSDVELYGANPQNVRTAPPETFASVEAYSEDFTTRYAQYRRLRSAAWDELLAHGLERTADGRFRERPGSKAADQLGTAQFYYRADWRAIRCPVLAIYAFQDAAWLLPDDASPELREVVRAYTERFDREHKGRNIARARRDIKDVRVVEMRGASHYCFLDREGDVVEELRRFL